MKKHFTLLLCVLAVTTSTGLSAPLPERTLKLTGDLLILPTSDRAALKKGEETADSGLLEVIVDGKLIHRVNGIFPRKVDDARFWAFLDMKEFKGKSAVLRITRGPAVLRGTEILGWMESSDHMRHTQPIYKEGGRPQFHFSQIQGWNNDPNGMVYSDGLWHLSWQCNPVENGFGGWYWGHAVSEDLVHWREAPRTLRSGGAKDVNRYPGLADANCFSGGAAVDFNNTLGKQVSQQKTLIAAFTDSPLGESLAYSTDGGFRYTVMRELNPIIVHPKPEGSKNWNGSYGRDPKLFWHEPTKRWVIVTYRMGLNPDAVSGHMTFYTSQDLKKWEFQSMTEKLFPEDRQPEEKQDFHECPEFLELPVDGNPMNKKWVLIDATPKYQTGAFDGKKFTPDTKEYRRGIYGGMKAGQCFSNAPDGRAIMMIWVRQGFGEKVPFASGFTLPLELTLRTADDGVRLYTNPVKELEKLREKEVFTSQGNKIANQQTVSFETQEPLLELVFTVKTASKTGAIELKFGPQTLYYLLDTKQLGENPLVKSLRDKCTVHDKDDGQVDFRLYLDRATWEAFVENGSVYKIGARRDIAAPIGKISLGTVGGAEGTVVSLKAYKLKSIWPEKVDTLMYSGKK